MALQNTQTFTMREDRKLPSITLASKMYLPLPRQTFY